LLGNEVGRFEGRVTHWRAWALSEDVLLVEAVGFGEGEAVEGAEVGFLQNSEAEAGDVLQNSNLNSHCLEVFLGLKKLRQDVEWVPSYRSIGVGFNPKKKTHTQLWAWVKEQLPLQEQEAIRRGETGLSVFELPVCYEMGEDWPRIETLSGRSKTHWIAKHSEKAYRVAAIGFLPGFVFLDGLDEALHVPRLERPRRQVPEGTIGIGGYQTGWYAISSPGGWNSIGRTPVPLLDIQNTDGSPTPVQVGDWVRFRPISMEEYDRLKAEQAKLVANRDSLILDDEESQEIADSKQSHPRIRVEVLEPGIWTSIQDAGRWSGRSFGIPSGGVADTLAWEQIHEVWGGGKVLELSSDQGSHDEPRPQVPVLECTLKGPVLKFLDAAEIVLTGAPMSATLDGRPIETGAIIRVEAGQTLTMGTAKQGCRAYIGIVASGFAGMHRFGSYAGMPGKTRLQGGERLEWIGYEDDEGELSGERDRDLAMKLSGELGREIGERLDGSTRKSSFTESAVIPRLRLERGPEWSWIPEEYQRLFLESDFVVGSQSNRMGIRLQLGEDLAKDWVKFREYWANRASMWSSPVVPGIMQLPPNGEPIVLGPDGQTLGGYPRIAYLPKDQQWRAAQLKPGDRLRFRMS
jgi:KipI family sensor histidine kinase inhibitor